MSEEKLSKKEYEEYIFLKQLRNNELAKIVKDKMYKQKLTADNMIVLQEKQLNKQKELLDKIKENAEVTIKEYEFNRKMNKPLTSEDYYFMVEHFNKNLDLLEGLNEKSN